MASQGFAKCYLTDDGAKTVDQGGKHTPMALVSTLWDQLASPLLFENIIENWSKQDGMQTALTIASPIVCWRVCRFEGLDMLDSRPIDFGDYTFQLPVYTSANGMSIAKILYTMVSAVSQAGNSWQGHYQSVVQVGVTWLLKNDNGPP